jgi:hypothetical protein
MPETWWAWAAIAAITYIWMGVGRVSEAFNASPMSRPGYARSGGPHILFSIFYEPIGALLFYSIGGPGRVPKMLVAAVVHFGLTLLAFWALSFVIKSEWIRAGILGGVIFLLAVPFLLPGRNYQK